MKYLENYNKFKKGFDDEINEKWYHNLLTGLMLLSPSISQAQNLNSIDNDGTKIETVSQQEVLEDIQSIIEHVKSNKKEFKNSEKVISQLERLLDKFKKGTISQESMNKIAQEFVKQSKNSSNPSISIASINNSHGERKFDNEKQIKKESGFTKVQEVTELSETIISKPTNILVSIYEEGNFESGTYNVDPNLAETLHDTINYYKSVGFDVSIVNIESSTDGQQLSSRLKQDLVSRGYTGDNKGLSRLRNDKLKDYVIENTDMDSTKISQDPRFKDDGVIDESYRYNKVVLELTKQKTGEVIQEESIICVYYKIYSGDNKRIEKDKKTNWNNTKNKKHNNTTDKNGCPIFIINK